MIQPQTYLTVADNTGAKKLMCIRVLGNNRKYANIEIGRASCRERVLVAV